MNTYAEKWPIAPLVCGLGVNGLALAAFAFSPFGHEYPLAVLGIVAFLLVQILLPACRICVEAPICPANVAQGFFWSQLVLVPILIGYYGLQPGTLPCLPSHDAVNFAIVLRVIAYVTFCLAFQFFLHPRNPRRAVTRPEDDDSAAGDGGWTWLGIGFFALVGLLGWLLFFGGVGGFVEYASSPLIQKERELEPTTLAGAAGNILKHFLGFAVVWAWSMWMQRRNAGSLAMVVTGIAVLALLLANFSYNRGTLLAPLLALAAAYSAHVRRLSFTIVGVAGVLVLAGAFTLGWYRSTKMEITDLATADFGATWNQNELVDFVQIYASGPQLSGFLIDEIERGKANYFGATIVPSLLYPIPILGKPFRESSGVYLFNELIYTDTEVLDQNIPYDAELYMNFHVPGVLAGFFLLGWFHSFLQRRFLATALPIESYVWLMLAVWTVFPGSLPVLSQLVVYSFWPIYGFLAFRKIAWRSSSVAKGWAAA